MLMQGMPSLSVINRGSQSEILRAKPSDSSPFLTLYLTAG